MRVTWGPIPRSRTLDSEAAGWRALAEPQPRQFAAQTLLLAGPLLVGAFALLLGTKEFLRSNPAALMGLLAFYVAAVPLHEFVHALCYPRGLFSEHLVVGAWPRHGLFYVLYDAPLSRRRVLTMLAAPLALFTVVLGGAVLVAAPGWRSILAQMLLVHTALCTGDGLTIARIARQVPAGALVQNDGWKTYWNVSES